MLSNKDLPPIILASGSPRRKELLSSLGLTFEVIKPDVDEKAIEAAITNPVKLVETLAQQKAQQVAENNPRKLVIGADTIVTINNEILGKPSDKKQAFNMLNKLQGHSHQVMTGISLWYQGQHQTSHGTTTVWMPPLTDQQLNHYVATGEPSDKAGAYAIQGLGSQFIQKIEGCYFNVVGFPVHLFSTELQKLLSRTCNNL